MSRRLPLTLLLLAACGRESAPPRSLETAAPTAPPSAVNPAGCPADAALLAVTADSAAAPTLAAARAATDTRERRAARLALARELIGGEHGMAKDPRRAFCILRPLYDAGVLAAAGDLGDLHRDAGQLERAAQLYGVDFGSGFVEDRERPVRGSLPEAGPSYRAWIRIHNLLAAHPDQRDALERAFREGARSGYGQERTARDTTRR